MTTDPDEIVILTEAAVEGRLTAVQAARLEQLVLTDPAAKRTYAELVSLSAELRLAGGAGAAPPAPRLTARRWPWAVAAAVCASVLVAVGTARPTTVATLTEAAGCRWAAGTLPTAAGSPLPAGRLALAEGLARILFASGVEVRLEGPAEIELLTPMRCVLSGGRLSAVVPPPATGFVVETPSSVVTDFGTEFGVTVGREAADVYVFQGRVDVLHRGTGSTENMLAGASLRFSPAGVGRVDPNAGPADDPPPAPLPAGTRRLQLSTAQGRGRDVAVQPATADPHDHRSDDLLFVKRAVPEKSDWDRRAYLGFDLTELDGATVRDAELVLTVAPTGYGYAALVPDATFGVYGVTDESLDVWAEPTLTWESAPASRGRGVPLDPAAAARLGGFVVPQGQQSGAFAVGGPALARFLAADRNGAATLVVVRETAATGVPDLVHGFASRRHPTLAPPTLRLTVTGGNR